ncbi:hypothetical protein Tco_0162410 [Tanacetum coccineum]
MSRAPKSRRSQMAHYEGIGRAEVEKDDQEWASFLGGKVFSGRKKSWGSNIKDGGKTVNGAIGACGGGIGSGEVFPGEAGE